MEGNTWSHPYDEDPNAQVEDALRLNHLQELLRLFQAHKPRTTRRVSHMAPQSPGKLDIEEFKETMREVLGTHKFDGQLENLFNKLDISHDNFVDWNEFTTYVLQQLREKDFLTVRKFRPFRGETKIRHIVHNRQEISSRIVPIDTPSRYLTIGREGAVTVWTPLLHPEAHFEVCEDVEPNRTQKRRVKMWVNDAIYMPNCRKLAVVTTGRDVHFFEVSSGHYAKEAYLYGLEDVPCCLDYHYDKKNPGGRSRLFLGDDEGNIHSFNFHQPLNSLFFPSKKNTGPQRIYFPDLRRHARFVEYITLAGVHSDMVRRVQFLPENGYILSASTSQHQSLVLLDELRKKRTYVFNVTKGVECFAYSKPLNLLVTGSSDHVVRVWNPYVTSRPIASLEGHAVSVGDVAIHEDLKLIISYSKDAVLKIWDPNEHSCLQTVSLKFPCAAHGPLLEHGPFPLTLCSSKSSVLLVASQDYLAHLRFSPADPVTTQSTTHLVQLCGAIYNPNFKQVVTAADDSTVSVWDLETGRRAIMLTECHVHEEITCLTFDLKFQRLITGARDGTIKTWSVQTGQCLQQLDAVAEAEVTGIVPLTDRPGILSVGWSRQICIYDDSNPENSPVKGDAAWPGGQLHTDDILSVSYLSPTLLATGSYDGVICVWSMEKCSLVVQLCDQSKRQKSALRSPLLFKSTSNPRESTMAPLNSCSNSNSRPNSRPNSRHRTDHRVPRGAPAPVDVLHFLSTRARQREGALLVSASGGHIKWWNIYKKRNLIDSFYAPRAPDESVLAMCTDDKDHFLTTGDTAGYITTWSITDYCLQQSTQAMHCRPPIFRTWLAHEGAIVSVCRVPYIHHHHDLLLTASTDKTAKLWTSSGKCIGFFGQKTAWNLKSPSTWHNTVIDSHCSDGSGGKDNQTDKGTAKEERGSFASSKTEDHLDANTPEGPSVKVEEQTTTSSKVNENSEVGPIRVKNTISDAGPALLATSPRSKTILGRKVEEDFERWRHNRQQRRVLDANVVADSSPEVSLCTTRNAKATFPFHALDMKPLDDIVLPATLSPRSMTTLGSQRPTPRTAPKATIADDNKQLSTRKPGEVPESSLCLPNIRKTHTTVGAYTPSRSAASGRRPVASAKV